MDQNDFAATVKRFGLDLEKLGFAPKQKNFLPPPLLPPEDDSRNEKKTKEEKEAISSMGRVLAGEINALISYHFPTGLIGGCTPRVIGEEESIVWHAAAEATDSERVHVVWQAFGDKIWYLAVPSGELASHPGTWCPFASVLPGMKDAVIRPPVCYTYYSDEIATMMSLTEDTLQIYRGTASVVRAKAERTARELGEAQIIELVPDIIERLAPLPWYSLSLFEDRARRILATVSIGAAVLTAAVALVIWFFSTIALISARTDLASITTRSDQKSLDLMRTVQGLRASPMRELIAKFTDLNDGLLELNAYLEVYQIMDGKILWRAIVPPNVTSNRISDIGGQTLDNSPQGVVIGNNRDALTAGVK